MKSSKSLLILELACAALTFSFAVCAQAQIVVDLADFSGPDGWGPSAPVVQATDGNFYGTTFAGGPYNSYGYGVFFKVTPTGKLTDLYNFCSLPNCADGKWPTSAPVLGRDGNLYGVVAEGGSKVGGGIVYQMTTGGQIKVLYTFCKTRSCTDGASPTGLILGGDGNFYGTTSVGGNAPPHSAGTIFSITPEGKFQLLYTFCSVSNCLDGNFPFAPPILGSDSNLYGVTYQGGTYGGGVLYRLTRTGTFQVLFNFPFTGSGSCGTSPFSVVRDANGNFFGTTQYGSTTSSTGAVFEITSAGECLVLHNFDYYTSPTWPYTGLTLASDGNIYGVDGGAINNGGSIFEITPDGAYTRLHGFLSNEGTLPVGPLFQGTDGSFYSTATYGPGSSNNGLVFLFSHGLGPLLETVPVSGSVGQSILVLGNHLTGSTAVTFNGVAAVFTVESDTYIKATVPRGATTGTVSVITPSGTLNSNPLFVVTR